jgi:COP9 signalosome complex subunit 4
MDSRLAQFAALNQKDKAPAYLSLVSEILARQDQSLTALDLHTLVETVVQDAGIVVGRQVLSELVRNLGTGSISLHNLRKRVVEETLNTLQPRIVSYEEQVRLYDCP